MPYADKLKQREAVKAASTAFRARQKAEHARLLDLARRLAAAEPPLDAAAARDAARAALKEENADG